jgi:hypothetical protein
MKRKKPSPLSVLFHSARSLKGTAPGFRRGYRALERLVNPPPPKKKRPGKD